MAPTRTWNRRGLVLATGIALAATPLAAAQAASGDGALAPLVGADDAAAIAGRYIVVLHDGGATDAASLDYVRAAGGTVTTTYDTVLDGFAADLTPAALAAVRSDPAVDYVAANQTVQLHGVQQPATWGIDRVDQRDLPLNDKYKYKKTGKGVTTYVIDTGINHDHEDFKGRIRDGFDTVGDGRGTNDCNGHGTHVSGTVGGTEWGVAKKVKIVPVRVIGCGSSGDWENIIDGIEWVAENHVKRSNATMSIGGPTYAPGDQAAAALVDEGVAFTLSAGNSSADACNFSPARESSAITVGGSADTDREYTNTNWGPCLDVYAPGEDVTSAWIGGDDAQNTISGTSMAAPHVAGAIALRLQVKPSATPAQLAKWVIKNSTKGKITDPGPGSPNRLLYTAP